MMIEAPLCKHEHKLLHSLHIEANTAEATSLKCFHVSCTQDNSNRAWFRVCGYSQLKAWDESLRCRNYFITLASVRRLPGEGLGHKARSKKNAGSNETKDIWIHRTLDASA